MNKANLPGFPPPLSSAIPSNTIPSVAPLSAPIPLPRSPNAQGLVYSSPHANNLAPGVPASGPSVFKMASNLAQTAKDVVNHAVQNGQIMASQDVAASRLATCFNCEFFTKDKQRCLKCGCFMLAKVKLEAAKCPIGKW